MKIHVEFTRVEFGCIKRLIRKFGGERVTEKVFSEEGKYGSAVLSEENDGSAVYNVAINEEAFEDACDIIEDMGVAIKGFYEGFVGLLKSRLPRFLEKWAMSDKERDEKIALDMTARHKEEIKENPDFFKVKDTEKCVYIVYKHFVRCPHEGILGRETEICRPLYGITEVNTMNGFIDAIKDIESNPMTIGFNFIFDGNIKTYFEAKEYIKSIEVDLDKEVDKEKRPSWFDIGTIDHEDTIDWDEIHKNDEEIDAAIDAAEHLCE